VNTNNEHSVKQCLTIGFCILYFDGRFGEVVSENVAQEVTDSIPVRNIIMAKASYFLVFVKYILELTWITPFSYLHTTITSRPFPIQVGRDHFLPLATILTHTFHFLHFHQIPHTRSPVSGTLDLALL
jgi:hypothetical protein